MLKRLPKLKSDRAAKNLLKKDLTDFLNPGNFQLTTFEFAPKDKTITVRLSRGLLNVIKLTARKRGINYQKLIREAVEEYLRKKAA